MSGSWNAGYSATPLPRKLGVKPGQRLALLDAPDGFLEHGLGAASDGVDLTVTLDAPVDLTIIFVTRTDQLEQALGDLERATRPDGAFWVAWPKRASGVVTDVTEDGIRSLILPRGLVDNKVCSISDVWSGLRICLRRELRGQPRRG
jgi:hypothetical protein